MCKKTRGGPTQTSKKVLPPTREHSFSKITKPEKSTKCIRNGTKREPWMRSKRTFRVPWLTGFITFWPCAPKPRKNAPNCVRSVQSKCRGRQTTKNKQHKVHTHAQKRPRKSQNDGKLLACGHSCATQKKPNEKSPQKMAGTPLRITFENLEKQAECAPPLPPSSHPSISPKATPKAHPSLPV